MLLVWQLILPPHNLGEIVNACILLLDNPNADDNSIREIIFWALTFLDNR